MREGHEEPPADVRSFLPRPGEPVESYAERLRALHRDLTLVLQAVERGLAGGEHHEPAVAAPASEAMSPVHVEHAEPQPPSRGPRVEVVSAPVGAHGRAAHHDEGPRDDPARPIEPAPVVEPRRRATDPPPGEPFGEAGDPRRPVESFPARPSDRDRRAPPAATEPAWVETAPGGWPQPEPPRFAIDPGSRRGEAPPVPPIAPRPPQSGPDRLPPLLLALMVTGWLLVAALVLALILDGP